ncbi:MAG: hypothetical protein SGARI_004751, partial [Bacillariaceae sp.]
MTSEIKPTIRTVTAFVNLNADDFEDVTTESSEGSSVDAKVTSCVGVLRAMEKELGSAGYVVQTVRIATNPFGEWLLTSEADVPSDDDNENPESVAKKAKTEQLTRVDLLDNLLMEHEIEFCSVGPAQNQNEAQFCPAIVAKSHRFSCSMVVDSGDVDAASCAAETILTIAKLDSGDHVKAGLGNFRFCAAASCKPYIPFFPAAKSISNAAIRDSQNLDKVSFAVGLENGRLARKLLNECQSVRNINTRFREQMAVALWPIRDIADEVAEKLSASFLGMDSSLNPSLDDDGSVAAAIEELEEVAVFGGPGTLGAAAEITKALQSLPDVPLVGYCGLMLPVCEDKRLAQLASTTERKNDRRLRITDLLSISSVCGVGIDTVPVPGNCSKDELSSLILDVAGIAGRWDKSLSCRVFPVPGKAAGEMTEFGSPYMVNS